MLTDIISYAETIKNKYRFEINGRVNTFSVLRSKFLNDQKNLKELCKKLYKKIK